MFFSIIIPAFNTEIYIEQCLDSIIRQTFSDYEVVIVDDGSTDNTRMICESYASKDRRFKVYHKDNGGASSARNYALQYISGTYVVFLDSDDFWNSEDVLKNIFVLLNESSSDVLYTTPIRFYPENDMYIPQVLKCNRSKVVYKKKGEAMNNLLRSDGLHTGMPRYIIKRKIIVDNHMNFVVGETGEDLTWCAKVLLYCNTFDVYTTPFYVYRKRKGSVSSTITQKKLDDLYNNIRRCTELAGVLDDEEALGAFLGYISFQFGTYMMAVAKNKNVGNDRNMSRVKEYKYLLKYGKNRKVKMLHYSTMLLGLKTTMKLLAHK